MYMTFSILHNFQLLVSSMQMFFTAYYFLGDDLCLRDLSAVAANLSRFQSKELTLFFNHAEQ